MWVEMWELLNQNQKALAGFLEQQYTHKVGTIPGIGTAGMAALLIRNWNALITKS